MDDSYMDYSSHCDAKSEVLHLEEVDMCLPCPTLEVKHRTPRISSANFNVPITSNYITMNMPNSNLAEIANVITTIPLKDMGVSRA